MLSVLDIIAIILLSLFLIVTMATVVLYCLLISEKHIEKSKREQTERDEAQIQEVEK